MVRSPNRRLQLPERRANSSPFSRAGQNSPTVVSFVAELVKSSASWPQPRSSSEGSLSTISQLNSSLYNSSNPINSRQFGLKPHSSDIICDIIPQDWSLSVPVKRTIAKALVLSGEASMKPGTTGRKSIFPFRTKWVTFRSRIILAMISGCARILRGGGGRRTEPFLRNKRKFLC